MFRKRLVPLCLSVALLIPGTALALIFDESTIGDLSDDPGAPTPLTFRVGSNTITGELDGVDDVRDYVTFEIGTGEALASLLLLEYSDATLPIPGNRGFHAINAGSTSFIPSPSTASSFLGGDHLDPLPAGTDLLPSLAEAALAGIGFEVPLGPGTYTYLVQQIDPAPTRYSLEFVIVPEPSAATLLLIGLVLMQRQTRRMGARRPLRG